MLRVKQIGESLWIWGILVTEQNVIIERLNQSLNQFFSSVSIAVSFQEWWLTMCQKHSFWRNWQFHNLDSIQDIETEILKVEIPTSILKLKVSILVLFVEPCLAHHFFTQYEVFWDFNPHYGWHHPHTGPLRCHQHGPVTRVVLIRPVICSEMDSWLSASGFKETARRHLT